MQIAYPKKKVTIQIRDLSHSFYLFTYPFIQYVLFIFPLKLVKNFSLIGL